MYNFFITLSCMEIGLYWYVKGTNNKWTYDFTNHVMVDVETIIALATKYDIVDAWMKKFSTTLLMKARI